MWGNIKAFDMHVKTMEGVTKQTLLGAVMSVIAIFVVVVLIFSEINDYMTPNIVSRMQADNAVDREAIKLHFDLDFMNIPCQRLTFKQEVVRGQVHHHEVQDEGILLDDKQYAEDSENPAIKTAGCWIHGSLITDKIAGNFVFKVKPESTLPNPRIAEMQKNSNFNEQQKALLLKEMQQLPGIPILPKMSHRINHMVFLPTDGVGSDVREALSVSTTYDSSIKNGSIRRALQHKGSMFSEVALQNSKTNVESDTGIYHYEIQVVPMHYRSTKGIKYDQMLNQYSVIERNIDLVDLAEGGAVSLAGQTFTDTYGIAFTYDFYPLILSAEEQSGSLFEFLSSLFGIIGGVITMIGLIERCLGASSKAVLGKKD